MSDEERPPLSLVPDAVLAPGDRPPAGLATRWKPGQSGLPMGGMAKKKLNEEMAAKFREHTDAARLALATIMLDSAKYKAADRIAAAREILNRGWGLAPLKIDIRPDDSGNPLFDPTKLSEDELWQMRALMEKARGEAAG